MVDVSRLLESKRTEVEIADQKIDKHFVKQFRANHRLTQIALANILGVTKKTIEKWEQGVNNVNGSSAVLLKLLNDNSALLSQLYNVKVVEGKSEANECGTNESKTVVTNREFWLNLFQTNDVALIAAITLCQRFAPQEELNDSQIAFIQEKKKWLDEDAPREANN